MDGDRPMADRRDLFESELQKLVREAFEDGWGFGDIGLPDPYSCCYAEREETYEMYDERIHELVVSYFDREASDVGAQDEAPETREVGDGVRSKTDMKGWVFKPTMFEEITDKIFREIELRFAQKGKQVAIGHCNLTELPDGSIHASIEYGPTDSEPREWPWNPSGY